MLDTQETESGSIVIWKIFAFHVSERHADRESWFDFNSQSCQAYLYYIESKGNDVASIDEQYREDDTIKFLCQMVNA